MEALRLATGALREDGGGGDDLAGPRPIRKRRLKGTPSSAQRAPSPPGQGRREMFRSYFKIYQTILYRKSLRVKAIKMR